MKKRFAAAAGALFAFGVIVACSSSDDTTPAPNYSGSCATLASQCHPYASKSALANECHEMGHAGDDSKCGPRLAECQAECPITDASEPLPFEVIDGQVVRRNEDGSVVTPPDASDGSTIPADCIPYCDCLQSTCNTQTGYPYATTADCQKACVVFSADERTCWTKHCVHAKDLSLENRPHSCDHALGKEGYQECPYGE